MYMYQFPMMQVIMCYKCANNNEDDDTLQILAKGMNLFHLEFKSLVDEHQNFFVLLNVHSRKKKRELFVYLKSPLIF